MRLQQLFAFLICNFLITPSLFAANMELYLIEKQLHVKVNNLQYPNEILIREMKSGLPNVLDMRVKLSGIAGFESMDQVRYIITYDLWDENYSVTTIKHDTQHQIVNSDAELLRWLSSVELNGLSTKQILRNKGKFELTFNAYFNPVKSERIKKIQNWIQTSKGYDVPNKELNEETIITNQAAGKDLHFSIGGNQTSGTKSQISVNNVQLSNGPRFQKLFDKILVEHMSQDAVAAQWKSKGLIKTFTIESLLSEKR